MKKSWSMVPSSRSISVGDRRRLSAIARAMRGSLSASAGFGCFLF